MNSKKETQFSKYLSYILRHDPSSIGLTLEIGGWVNVDALLSAINGASTNKFNIDLEELKLVVEHDEKGRYSFNDDMTKIRANQGHSVKTLDMEYAEIEPLPILYHGTSRDNYEKILASGGIKHMERQYVHLSTDYDTALKVGKRHGKPIVLIIDSGMMYRDCCKFYKSENGVYLTDYVDSKYIKGTRLN